MLERLRELRADYPGLGAEKLQLFLADWCEPHNLTCPKVRNGTEQSYISTFTDVHSRFALAVTSTSKSSKGQPCCGVVPSLLPVSDRTGAIGQRQRVPSPRMNAHERFNGSIQVEFIAYNEDLLFTDVDLCNDKLLDYLVRFNTERPHYGLRLKLFCEFLQEHHQCNMYWRKTPALGS